MKALLVQQRLQGPEGTRGNISGAGVAVQSQNTGIFQAAAIDFPVQRAIYVPICHDSKICINHRAERIAVIERQNPNFMAQDSLLLRELKTAGLTRQRDSCPIESQLQISVLLVNSQRIHPGGRQVTLQIFAPLAAVPPAELIFTFPVRRSISSPLSLFYLTRIIKN